MKYVIGLGEALFDCLPTGRKLGGAPANFAYHVSQFGFQSYAISAIGNDELGQEIIDTFEQVGLHYCLPKVDYPTGTVQVTLDEKGIPQYEICLGVAWIISHRPMSYWLLRRMPKRYALVHWRNALR